MADFGDEMGEILARELFQWFKSQSKSFVQNSQQFNAQMIDAYSKHIDKWIEKNKKRREELDKAIKNGKSGEFDLTDGKPQFFKFDLPEGLTSEEKQELKDEVLQPILEEQGLTHPETYFIGKDSEGHDIEVDESDTIGFMFEDDGGDPQRAQAAIEAAELEFDAYEPIKKLESAEHTFARIRGFGLLDEKQRAEFAKQLGDGLEQAGCDRRAIGVIERDPETGALGGDLTVNIDDPATRKEAIRAVREACKRWTDVLAGTEFPVALTATASRFAAADLGPDSFDAVSSIYTDFMKNLEREGFEPHAVFDADGVARFTYKPEEKIEGELEIVLKPEDGREIEFDNALGLSFNQRSVDAIPQKVTIDGVKCVKYEIPAEQAINAREAVMDMARRQTGEAARYSLPNLEEFEKQAKDAIKRINAATNVPDPKENESIIRKTLFEHDMLDGTGYVSEEEQARLLNRLEVKGDRAPSFENRQAHALKAALHMQKKGLTFLPDKGKIPKPKGFQETEMPRLFHKGNRG